MEKVPYLGESLTRWQVGNSTFLAMPERGARLMNWHLTHGDGSVRDIIYWPETKSLTDFHKARGGNPILFPFSARTFDRGEIQFWRDSVTGQRHPMPMHGFARQGTFTTERLDARGFTALYVPSDEARAAYPFNYEFRVAYRFAPLALTCEFTLLNLDTRPIPWSAGHHFYFTLPWTEGLARSRHRLRSSATRTLRQDATNGKLIPGPALTPVEPLDNLALIDTFHLGLNSNVMSFGPTDGSSEVIVKNGTAATPAPETTFVTWTMGPDAPFYCVEPWMSPPNAPETQLGLQWVAPGQTQSFIVEVAVK
jgi:galactose mutarotase-like enzyme